MRHRHNVLSIILLHPVTRNRLPINLHRIRATKITNAMKGMPDRIAKYEAVSHIVFEFSRIAVVY